MPYQTRPSYSDFLSANGETGQRLSACLQQIVSKPETHARFLNTLSMLEHMGAYRIMATQSNPDMRQDVLKHMSEEARHAFFFKRQADKVAGESMDWHPSRLIAPSFARLYFKRLESRIAQEFRKSPKPMLLTYYCMSMIIEYRAIWAFDLYQNVLDESGAPLSLKSVLAEEQGHLDDIEGAIAGHDAVSPDRLLAFFRKEHALFGKLLGALESRVS